MRNGISVTVFAVRSSTTSGFGRRPQRFTKARLARRNRLAHGRGAGQERNHAPDGQVKDVCWRWQERFMEEGFEGLLRDKTRPSRIEPLIADVAERVVATTLIEPRGEPPRPLHIPLHAYVVFVAQRRRRLTHQAAIKARCLRLGRRPTGRHQSLRRRT
jgi:hypothetical protein